MCCGLFAPTQFHFECCGVFDDSRKLFFKNSIYIYIYILHIYIYYQKCSKNMKTLWKVVQVVRKTWVLVAKDKSNHPVADSLRSVPQELELNNFIR